MRSIRVDLFSELTAQRRLIVLAERDLATREAVRLGFGELGVVETVLFPWVAPR